MKIFKCIIAMLLCAMFLTQMAGCGSFNDAQYEPANPVEGATVFRALKNQIDFDSEISEVENAEDLFVNLPDDAEVTLLQGPNQYSDQLGMVEVKDKSDLDIADESVDGYLQDQYDSVYESNPQQAVKFENVAKWKNEVYIVFCITINYTAATEIINNTVNGGNHQSSNTPDEVINSADQFLGKWEICGYSAAKETDQFVGVEISSSSITLTMYGETITNTYEILEVNGYSCLLMNYEGESLAAILINPDMLVFSFSEGVDDITLRIQGKEYAGEFFPISNVLMREGSWTTNIPNNINFAEWEREFDKNEMQLYYYPTSNILQVWGGNPAQEIYCEGVFYVYESGSLEYMEAISLPWAKGLPSKTIYTNHNFVITDNK